VIADPYVEMDFGTGALKITPAHDTNDYALGQRHGLQSLMIMNKDGTMNGLVVHRADCPPLVSPPAVWEVFWTRPIRVPQAAVE
jgi:hypothetical protein